MTGGGPQGEDELITRLFAPLARGAPGALGLRDDAALITPSPGAQLVVTADLLSQGVHFRAADAPDLVARKALRVNLSDLAAKGAQPLAYMLSVAWPRGVQGSVMAAFARGLDQDGGVFALTLLGGDTVVHDGPWVIAVTAFGEVPSGAMIPRSGGAPGDLVWVSGCIGDAALGLGLPEPGAPEATAAGLSAAQARALRRRYLLPEPRCALGLALRGVASACLDVSDGLALDLQRLCAASGTGAQVDAACVPLSQGGAAVVAADPSRLPAMLTGGDDYELLFTVPPHNEARVRELSGTLDLPLTRIGVLDSSPDVRIHDGRGHHMTLPAPGYNHFPPDPPRRAPPDPP